MTSVNLSENNISNLGAQALLQMFRAHHSLVQLQLDLNPVPVFLRVKIRMEASKKREIFSAQVEDQKARLLAQAGGSPQAKTSREVRTAPVESVGFGAE